MFAFLFAVAVGLKGLGAVAGGCLLIGGYLGAKYGPKAKQVVAADLSKAGQAVSSVSNKV